MYLTENVPHFVRKAKTGNQLLFEILSKINMYVNTNDPLRPNRFVCVHLSKLLLVTPVFPLRQQQIIKT